MQKSDLFLEPPVEAQAASLFKVSDGSCKTKWKLYFSSAELLLFLSSMFHYDLLKLLFLAKSSKPIYVNMSSL